MLELRPVDGGVEFALRVAPRASRDAVAGLHGDRLRVAVAAPPQGGRANRAVERLLASALGVPRCAVSIVAGARARQKTVRVSGISPRQARQRLERVLAES
ncbi:MAG: DUF167 domain-containing protein [Candidatus Brocadiia bacterium]